MAAQVVVVGSYNQDHVWHLERMVQAGETLRGHGFASGPGGKGFNQAVACVRQDVATAFVGAHGDDALGEQAERMAHEEHLEGRWQVDAERATGSACILVETDGQNRIIVDLGANERLSPAHIDAQANLFADARVLLAQMEIDIDCLAHALARSREHSLLTLLNPAPVHPQATSECLRLADVLLPNEGEFAELCRRFAGHDFDADAVAAMDDASLHALARRLTDASVVITLGAQGCFVSHGESRRGDSDTCYRLPQEKVDAVDTTGAGDAFCGALAAASVQLADQPFRAAVTHANRVAAMATERHGAALAMPRHDEVMARFAKS
ncbi:MAG TPA: ribokinase [Rhodanobacteraceae bacterium]|nr:ribokinase [Rhodanobacteraceae bacterium]